MPGEPCLAHHRDRERLLEDAARTGRIALASCEIDDEFNEALTDVLGRRLATEIHLDLSHATFTGLALFPEMAFTGITSFDGTTFAIGAHFADARFPVAASFKGAKFERDTTFARTVFEHAAVFDGASFTGRADFTAATFAGYTEFTGVAFEQDANFHGAAFAIVSFISTSFRSAPTQPGATATAPSQSDLGGDSPRFADHASVGFSRFDNATFTGNAYFSLSRFFGGARFARATFHQQAHFDGVEIDGRADFTDATFSDEGRGQAAVATRSV